MDQLKVERNHSEHYGYCRDGGRDSTGRLYGLVLVEPDPLTVEPSSTPLVGISCPDLAGRWFDCMVVVDSTSLSATQGRRSRLGPRGEQILTRTTRTSTT